MVSFPVMKKLEEKVLIKGFEPVFLLIGVFLLMFSIVGLFLGSPTILKLIFIVFLDIVAIVIFKHLSADNKNRKKLFAFFSDKELIIKDK
jgi:hypothetical protein